MAKNRRGRAIDGILILDKPEGPTSNQALQSVKRLFDAAKAGHTGSLDPLATGVLPICFGEATKFTQFLLEADKIYRATFRLGVSTTTGDAQGAVIGSTAVPGLTEAAVEAAMAELRGVIAQIPSMYSALKQGGRPLYELARQGIEVERPPREVRIHEFRIDAFRAGEHPEVDVLIHCSKGTYIRTLAEDLGRALGCGAHVTWLRRVVSGPFGVAGAVSLEQLRALRDSAPAAELDRLLQPADAAVADRHPLTLTDNLSWYFLRGQPVTIPELTTVSVAAGDLVRVFAAERGFLGLGEVLEGRRIKPHRLVRSA